MNGNDLMDALSGLDPNYIDEAAYELHALPAGNKKVHRFRVNRGLLIAMPIAAAVLLTFMVALPALIRTGSSTAPASDGAAYESGMADVAYDAESAAETSEPEAPEYYEAETAETPAASEDSAYQESAGSAKTEAASEDAMSEPVSATASASEGTGPAAIYEDGSLRIDTYLNLPEDVSTVSYSIKGTDHDGSDHIFSEGMLSDILAERDPLILDISALDLPDGSFILTIDGHDMEFTKQSP